MKEIERIIRVDHAGEYGAINIYSAQLMLSRVFYKDIVSTLEEMLANEKEHFALFSRIMEKRSIRHCYALRFWAIGGFLLGLVTASFGRNAIWVCTNSIETTVLHHLQWQLAFLQQHDTEVYDAVFSIKSDEEAHQASGQENGKESAIYRPIFFVVRKSTELAIWLSTKL